MLKMGDNSDVGEVLNNLYETEEVVKNFKKAAKNTDPLLGMTDEEAEKMQKQIKRDEFWKKVRGTLTVVFVSVIIIWASFVSISDMINASKTDGQVKAAEEYGVE